MKNRWFDMRKCPGYGPTQSPRIVGQGEKSNLAFDRYFIESVINQFKIVPEPIQLIEIPNMATVNIESQLLWAEKYILLKCGNPVLILSDDGTTHLDFFSDDDLGMGCL